MRANKGAPPGVQALNSVPVCQVIVSSSVRDEYILVLFPPTIVTAVGIIRGRGELGGGFGWLQRIKGVALVYVFIMVASQAEACGTPEANTGASETTCGMSGGRSRKGLEPLNECEVARRRRTCNWGHNVYSHTGGKLLHQTWRYEGTKTGSFISTENAQTRRQRTHDCEYKL